MSHIKLHWDDKLQTSKLTVTIFNMANRIKWQVGGNTLTIQICIDLQTVRHYSFANVTGIQSIRYKQKQVRFKYCKTSQLLRSMAINFRPLRLKLAFYSKTLCDQLHLNCLRTQRLVSPLGLTFFILLVSLIHSSLNN